MRCRTCLTFMSSISHFFSVTMVMAIGLRSGCAQALRASRPLLAAAPRPPRPPVRPRRPAPTSPSTQVRSWSFLCLYQMAQVVGREVCPGGCCNESGLARGHPLLISLQVLRDPAAAPPAVTCPSTSPVPILLQPQAAQAPASASRRRPRRPAPAASPACATSSAATRPPPPPCSVRGLACSAQPHSCPVLFHPHVAMLAALHLHKSSEGKKGW